MIYVPSVDIEPKFKDKPPIYKKMAEKIERLYSHIAGACVAPPQIGGVPYVQEVISRESFYVDCARLPKRFEESIEMYHENCEDAIALALASFELAGHQVEDP